MSNDKSLLTKGVISTTSPGWRPLLAVAAVVVFAHFLLLQASPSQFGAGADPDDAGGKILSTRSIEAAPPAAVTAPAQPKAPSATPKSVKTAQNAPKIASNQPPAQQTYAQAAPEIVANPEPQNPAPTAPPVAEAQAPAATPTQTIAAQPAGPQTTPVNAVRLPGSTRLLYKMVGMAKNLNYQADSELNWKTDGDNYQAVMKVSLFFLGSRSLISVGKITGSGLAPTRFSDKSKAELAAHFEADKGKITFSANTPDAPWIDGVQDRVSVFLQLSGILAAKPQDFPLGSNITFLTVGPRDTDTWTFVIEAEETLGLMGTQMPTLKVTRKPRKEFDQKVEIWFAPSLGYLPVRNRVTQPNGDFIDQQLNEIAKS